MFGSMMGIERGCCAGFFFGVGGEGLGNRVTFIWHLYSFKEIYRIEIGGVLLLIGLVSTWSIALKLINKQVLKELICSNISESEATGQF